MTRTMHTFAVALMLAVPSFAQAQSPELLAAADRMIQVQDMNAMMKDMASNMAKSLPENVRAAFVAEMTDETFLARYKGKMRTVMAKTFTVEEMNALSDFYAKPIAKTAMAKMGTMMGDMMPFLQGEMPELMKRIDKRVPKPEAK
jgi:uncharacterized protein